MLNREIPFLRIIIPLCLGIISGLYIHPGIYGYLSVIIISLAGLLLSLSFNNRPNNYIYGITICICLYTCGIMLYSAEKNRISPLKPERTIFISKLTDYPEEKENSFMLSVRLKQGISVQDTFNVRGSMVLYLKKDSVASSLVPGDIFLFTTTPQEIVNRGNPMEFNYKFYMATKGTRYYGFVSPGDIIAVQHPSHRDLKANALIIRNKIIKLYEKRGITGERLALVAAITLGEKSMLDPDQKQNFIKAGVMHIMAVSGLHAVILSLFILNLFFFLKRRFNICRILIAVIFLWAFAFVTGLTPSVLRATLMFSFLQAGTLMKRKVNGINSVLASAFVLILIRPSVIFDAGFLLSYAAVLYIVGFYQDLYLKINCRHWLPDKIWQSVAVTLIAQAGTLPLTVMLFNRFPTYFIITNLLIVPLSSLLIIIGCLVPMTYPIVPVSTFLASVLDTLTGLTELLTAKAASLPYSTIDFLGITPSECILLSAAISLTVYFLINKHSVSIKFSLLAFLVFTVVYTADEIITRKSNELIVYNTPGNSTVGIRTGKVLNLYTETRELPLEVVRHASAKRLRIVQNPYVDPCFVKADKMSVLITDTLRSEWQRAGKPSVIILTGTRPLAEKNTLSAFSGESILILSEASPVWRISGSKNQSYAGPIWFVRKSGAYRVEI